MLVPQLPSLPVVDISAFVTGGSDQQKNTCAKELDTACRDIGFFYLTGHGISEEQAVGIRELAKEFFDLPEEEKEEISITKTDFARGYQRLGRNITKYAKDWHEAIDLYAPVLEGHPLLQRNSKTLTGTNPIPRRPENFKARVDTYVEAMKSLGMAMMRAMAVGLGLKEDYFVPYMNDGFWVMRLIGYPPLKTDVEGVGISCGEHTDYGCVTILNTDDTPGSLQVKSKTGEWINVDPIPGTFVINIGDMLNIWTNGIYTSTLHRVIHTKHTYRVSVPFFFEPNFGAVIEPLQGCVNETGGKALHGRVMYGNHLLSKVENNFDVGAKDGGM